MVVVNTWLGTASVLERSADAHASYSFLNHLEVEDDPPCTRPQRSFLSVHSLSLYSNSAVADVVAVPQFASYCREVYLETIITQLGQRTVAKPHSKQSGRVWCVLKYFNS